jgi:transcriptional regulator with XRE-family HTH domain
MSTKQPELDGREGRRRRAWELKQQGWKQQGWKQQGWKQQDSTAALGVTPGAVSQWLKRARERGVEALWRHPAPGRQSRLTPELNPDEGIWNDLKRVELANLCAHDLAEVALALRRAKERPRHKRSVIQACIRQAGYHV